MRKRLMTIAMTGLLTVGGIGVAAAAPGDNGKAGPNSKNNHGLCTAYFNGQKKGHDKGSPAPFAALEDDADEWAGEESADNVYNYCNQYGIGGNPAENGRFTGCFDGDQDEDGQVCND